MYPSEYPCWRGHGVCGLLATKQVVVSYTGIGFIWGGGRIMWKLWGKDPELELPAIVADPRDAA